MKIKKQYVRKYLPTSDETFKPQEVSKIANKINEHTERTFWQWVIPVTFIIIFVIFAIYIMITGGI